MISFAVQHHPSRAPMGADLAATVGGADVVCDPDPDGFRSPWRCYRHCLETTPQDATHRVVLQDDVLPCPGFREAAEAAIRAQPDRLITFFVAGAPREYRDSVYRACNASRPFAELRNSRWTPAVALAWPKAMIAPLLEFVDAQNWPQVFRADDEIIGRFTRHAEVQVLATVPCLIEHPDEVASTVGMRAAAGRNLDRVSCCFIGDCDPATINWALPPHRSF